LNRAISEFETVKLGVPQTQMKYAHELLNAMPKRNLSRHAIEMIPIENDDTWCRDIGKLTLYTISNLTVTFESGPTFVQESSSLQLHGISWKFNGWGNKVGFEKDIDVADRILESCGVPKIASDFVLEGGSIHVDGEGTLITTEECLLHPNRNLHLT
jgi:agmatine deiminase